MNYLLFFSFVYLPRTGLSYLLRSNIIPLVSEFNFYFLPYYIENDVKSVSPLSNSTLVTLIMQLTVLSPKHLLCF